MCRQDIRSTSTRPEPRAMPSICRAGTHCKRQCQASSCTCRLRTLGMARHPRLYIPRCTGRRCCQLQTSKQNKLGTSGSCHFQTRLCRFPGGILYTRQAIPCIQGGNHQCNRSLGRYRRQNISQSRKRRNLTLRRYLDLTDMYQQDTERSHRHRSLPSTCPPHSQHM